MDLRGKFQTDADGRYYMRTIVPCGYMIPMDGPVGDMIRAQKRHGYRPAHIHFLVSAPGYREVVTALYVAGDEHLDTDTVFGPDASLVVTVEKNDPKFADPESAQPALRLSVGRREAGWLGPSGRRSIADSQRAAKRQPLTLTSAGVVRRCRRKRQLNQEARAFFLVGVSPQLAAVIENRLVRESQSQPDSVLFSRGYERLK